MLVPASAALFGALALGLSRLPWTLATATAAAVLAALAVGALLARPGTPAPPLVALGLVPRALAATCVVAAVAVLARVAGPLLVGALTPLPVVVGVLVVFAQRSLGVPAAIAVLAGAARATIAFATFFAVVGAALGRLPVGAAYALATLAACTVGWAVARRA